MKSLFTIKKYFNGYFGVDYIRFSYLKFFLRKIKIVVYILNRQRRDLNSQVREDKGCLTSTCLAQVEFKTSAITRLGDVGLLYFLNNAFIYFIHSCRRVQWLYSSSETLKFLRIKPLATGQIGLSSGFQSKN